MIESSSSFRDTCAIVGAGHSRLGKVPGTSSLDLLIEAMRNAIDDSGVSVKDIDGIICRGPDDSYSHHQMIGERLGINVKFSTTLTNGGASQILSIALAVMAIQGGMAKTVICGFGRNSWSRTHASEEARVRNETRPESQRAKEFGPEYGYFGATAAHAFGATRHMHLYGTTRDDFGAIATAFREHALRNPDAQMKKPLTMEQYREAREIVAPFGLFDCSLRSDGAGALIVTRREHARDLKQPPVLIKGFGTYNNTRGWFADDNMVVTAAKKSGEAAYAMAGLGPEDVDTAQIYDCFTYMVLTQLEDYGFCKKGEGGAFVSSGALRMGGRLPTNTSGGQLSEAHVEGVLQIVEGARQMRHTYPAERQVKDAEIALISGHGGNQVCHSTLILGRA
ncbi:MAG TPA: thiolase family protein [Xanthobacteraceae bacterium]|jgi:acetyl-CoA acetyltransferase|nr:thiolase family protein [Xanthobacteraceae bacterium]